jgi:hypothetical protein
MKRLLLIAFTMAVIITTTSAQEKKISFGLKTGLNLSIFSASINSEAAWRPGFHIGGYLKTPLSEKISFRPELYYSSQGQKDEYYQPPNGPTIGETTTKTNYLNLPLLLEFGNKLSFQAGPQLGFLLSANESGTIQNEPIDEDLKSIMKGTDVSLVLGTGIQAGPNVNLGLRLNLGLTEVFDGSGSNGFPGIKNRVLHFYIGYTF